MKIALIQTNCGEDEGANIAANLALVEQAAKGGAKFVALPENAFLMLAQGGDAAYPPYHAENHAGVVAVKALAKQHGVWVLIGSVALLDEATGKRRNTSILINDGGEVAARYDKIHLFDVDLPNGESYRESARIAGGEKAVVVDSPLGALGLSICYDVRFPQLYRRLAQKGARVFTVPAAFTYTTGQAHWEVLLRARAIENGAFVLAPAQCGTHAGGRKTWGHSMVIDPWGKILAQAGHEVGIVEAELNLSLVDEVRQRIPSLQHDREFQL